MKNILTKILEIITLKNGYQSGLEYYIQSKKPTSSADVERFSREYNEKVCSGHFSC
jgi:hypothetical protein